jgi:hypothetical protein
VVEAKIFSMFEALLDWAVGDLLKLSVGMSPLDVVLQASMVVTVKIKSSIRNILGYPQSAEN